MIVYKVFYQDWNSYLYSTNRIFTNVSCFLLKYTPNLVQSSPTGIYCFKTLDDAKMWKTYCIDNSYVSHSKLKIYQCKATNVRKVKYLCKYFYVNRLQDYLTAKNKKKKISNLSCVKPAPKGTYLCSSIQLLKEVND